MVGDVGRKGKYWRLVRARVAPFGTGREPFAKVPRLLTCTTRNVSLTEIGKACCERCLQILANVEEANNVVQALQSTPRDASYQGLGLNSAADDPVLAECSS